MIPSSGINFHIEIIEIFHSNILNFNHIQIKCKYNTEKINFDK